MSPNGSAPSHAAGTTFYNDDSDNHSNASPLSHIQQSSAGRTGAGQAPAADAPDCGSDTMNIDDDRRPSVASVNTASSQGSKLSATRGGFRKLQGFFGEEFPGRDSSEGSLPTSIAGKDQRARSYSHSRPAHRDRNYSNASSHTREPSPSSSRPRTPVPAPEVVPFLYQDTTVSPMLLVSPRLMSYMVVWRWESLPLQGEGEGLAPPPTDLSVS